VYLLKQYIKTNENTTSCLYRVSAKLDEDGTGVVSHLGFTVAMEKVPLGLSENQIKAMFQL
jgi:hypothetical protein